MAESGVGTADSEGKSSERTVRMVPGNSFCQKAICTGQNECSCVCSHASFAVSIQTRGTGVVDGDGKVKELVWGSRHKFPGWQEGKMLGNKETYN